MKKLSIVVNLEYFIKPFASDITLGLRHARVSTNYSYLNNNIFILNSELKISMHANCLGSLVVCLISKYSNGVYNPDT